MGLYPDQVWSEHDFLGTVYVTWTVKKDGCETHPFLQFVGHAVVTKNEIMVFVRLRYIYLL